MNLALISPFLLFSCLSGMETCIVIEIVRKYSLPGTVELGGLA